MSLFTLPGCTDLMADDLVAPGASVLEADGSPYYINFPRRGGQPVTVRELDIWARNRNLLLMRDCPTGGIRNDFAEVIPPYGLEFELRAPTDKRVYLYLDMVTFRPLQSYEPYENRDATICDTERDLIRYPDARRVLARVRWLEVIVNEQVVHTLYQGGGVFIDSPVRVTIPREVARGGDLKISLLPSPGEGFFAIWDAFLSSHRDRSSIPVLN